MGWCSGTYVFDEVCAGILNLDATREDILVVLIGSLQAQDWDCECDSDYINHPMVKVAMERVDPSFYEDV